MSGKSPPSARRPKNGSVSRLSKQKSVMEIINNPFQVAAVGDPSLHVDNLNDAKLIGPEDFEMLIYGALMTCDDNEERIDLLNRLRLPYLFKSAQLLTLCGITTSQKTQMRFIEILGPRLVDPFAGSVPLSELFRFNTEKEHVEEILKARNQTLSKTKLTLTASGRGNALTAGGRGRGAGAGAGRRLSLPQSKKGQCDTAAEGGGTDVSNSSNGSCSSERPPRRARPASLPASIENTVFQLHGLEIRMEQEPEGLHRLSESSAEEGDGDYIDTTKLSKTSAAGEAGVNTVKPFV